jgi:hypothetical protein
MFEYCLWSQKGAPLFTCSAHLREIDSSQPDNQAPCNTNFSQFNSLHVLVPEDMIGTVKVNVNFIFVQNVDSVGNFQLSNAEHMTTINGIVQNANSKLDQLIEHACNCTIPPVHYDRSFIEIVPHFIEVRSDLLFDHMNDPALILGNVFR